MSITEFIDTIKVSVIISNFQGMNYLPRCLKQLMTQTYKNYEVIFVDAGSTDGSIEYVRKNYPRIKIFKCDRIGIGEAINIGINNSSGDILIFDFNTDEYVQPDWLEELVKFLKRYNFDIIAGTTRIIDGTDQIDESGVNINWFGKAKKIGHKKKIEIFQFNEEPVDFVGSPSFHRKLLKKIGLVDESYFIYAEDLDFCYRAKLLGIETRCSSRARSHHEIRGTIGINSRKLEYYLRRSTIRFQLIFFSPLKLFFSLFYLCIFLPFTSFFVSILNIKQSELYKEKLWGRIEAIKWNTTHINETLKSRKEMILKKI